MRIKQLTKSVIIFIGLILPTQTYAQSWKFIKEKDGVKLYSRHENGNTLQTFKGVSEFKVPLEKVFTVLEDIHNREWWDKNLDQIKLLKYEKNKKSQYYLVYKMPWPFANRDMYVDVTTTINSSSGERKLTAVPLVGIYPENKNLVRIKNYRQQWLVRPINRDLTYIELEFYISAAENLPEWLINMIMTETPMNAINGLRLQVKK